MIDRDNPWGVAWNAYAATGQQQLGGEHPFHYFTKQPVPEQGDLALQYEVRPGPLALLPGLLGKLSQIDGYSERADVWGDGAAAVRATDPDDTTLKWGGYTQMGSRGSGWRDCPPMAIEVDWALLQWVKQWQLMAQTEVDEEADEYGDKLRPDWGTAWQIVYVLWDVFAAPEGTGGTSCLEMSEGGGLTRWQFGKAIVDLATLGLQVQHAAAVLKPTGDQQWDIAAQATLLGVRQRVYTSVNCWCRGYLIRASRVPGVAAEIDTPLPPPPARHVWKRPRMGAQPRRGSRYTYRNIRSLLLLVLLALVGLVSGVAGMTPLQQGIGGTFRSHA
jgi:hypothetical protein